MIGQYFQQAHEYLTSITKSIIIVSTIILLIYLTFFLARVIEQLFGLKNEKIPFSHKYFWYGIGISYLLAIALFFIGMFLAVILFVVVLMVLFKMRRLVRG